MKLCKDCKHYVFNPSGKPQKNYDTCARGRTLSLVDGEIRDRDPPQYCTIERTTEGYLYCGAEAQFFEAASP